MKMKELPSIERPREKLLRYGPDRLSSAELIAIILITGSKKENVMQLSHKILKMITDEKLMYYSIEKLVALTGIGKAKACCIVSCIELGKRLLAGKQSSLILSPNDVWKQLQDIREQKKEHFIVFYLDIRNQILKKDVISIGTLNASLVHPREVFEPAIRDSAAQLILCHNHPSGIVDPSDEDIKLTQRLSTAGEILGIEVIDHIIISKDGYLSFKEHGLI